MSDNTAQKLIFAHFTVYFKTIVLQPASICIMRNVYTSEYVGGNGIAAWNPLDEEHVRCYAENDLICDMFVVPLLMSRANGDLDGATPCNWQPVTGYMPQALNADVSVQRMVYFEGCDAFTHHWGMMGDIKSFNPAEKYNCSTDPAERKFNTICMQELQIRIDPNTLAWNDVTEDKGHWGDNVMPGMGAVISGHKAIFDEADYKRNKIMQLR